MSAIRKAVLLGGMLGLLSVSGCSLGNVLGTATPETGRPDFSHLIPDAWTIEQVEEIDVDGDDEVEWLVIYRYDKSSGGFGGPLGGVVYDRQPDRSPENPSRPEPYRSAILVAYHLLPAAGGSGYLGEKVGDEGEPKPEVGTYDVNGDGKKELAILGYSFPGFATSLAVFRWVGKARGYQVMIHAEEGDADVLWGDAGIELEPAFGKGPIKTVVVRSRLYHPYWYLRSRLGRRVVYEWDDNQTKLEKKSENIDFVFGRPQGAYKPKQKQYPVAYPEAAVLAYYEDGRVKDIVSVQENSSGAQVNVRVIADDQLVEDVCSLTRKSTGKVKDVTKWEVSCPE